MTKRDLFMAIGALGEIVTSWSDATPKSAEAFAEAAAEHGESTVEHLAVNATKIADAMCEAAAGDDELDLLDSFARAAMIGELAAQDSRADGKGTGIVEDEHLDAFGDRCYRTAAAFMRARDRAHRWAAANGTAWAEAGKAASNG